MTIFLVGLIPLTLFLKNYHQIDLKKNLKKTYDLFLGLIIIFLIYYYLRSQFTEENSISFFQN